MVSAFISPKEIISGEGSMAQLGSITQNLGAEHAFIFADPVLVKLGVTARAVEALKAFNIRYTIFSQIQAEPGLQDGNIAIEAVRSSGADLVIGIGGGSCLDLAKAAAVLAANAGLAGDYLNLSGTKKLQSPGLPKILLPTTAGTGSEVTDIAVFSLHDTKDVISHPYLLADTAIIDPELTYTLPPKMTAASGMDALTHAIEAYLSIQSDDFTDALALEAVRKIYGNIRTAVWQGGERQARREMAIGSMMAGLSFFNAGVAGVHALAYPLGGLFKIPHGESNAVLLPYVMEYIWPSSLNKMARLAAELGIERGNRSDRELALLTVGELKSLVEETGLPTSLSYYGITEKDIESLAHNGMKQTRLLSRSPRPLTIDAAAGIYRSALRGNLKMEKNRLGG
ncbi:iron-containing alcohol dehydrogenase [Peribacillus sp. SCS-37]|uniref:iron-containing alcohol dehydrogenase n=1 Tax=Paraperibacillus esterisolvens TaxID=3115296 RepID=UPI0039061EE1